MASLMNLNIAGSDKRVWATQKRNGVCYRSSQDSVAFILLS